jgi:hypothetical protein
MKIVTASTLDTHLRGELQYKCSKYHFLELFSTEFFKEK